MLDPMMIVNGILTTMYHERACKLMKLSNRTIEIVFQYGDKKIIRQIARYTHDRQGIAKKYLLIDTGLKISIERGFFNE
jgi:hypothetical protein